MSSWIKLVSYFGGATLLIAGLSLIAAETYASDVNDDELCEVAVKYSARYFTEEDASVLHRAAWTILEGKNSDDVQKFVGLVIFHMGQEFAYKYDSELHDPETYLPEIIGIMNTVCEEGLSELRGASRSTDLNDMGSDGEIW
jgi:hypothetical protein